MHIDFIYAKTLLPLTRFHSIPNTIDMCKSQPLIFLGILSILLRYLEYSDNSKFLNSLI